MVSNAQKSVPSLHIIKYPESLTPLLEKAKAEHFQMINRILSHKQEMVLKLELFSTCGGASLLQKYFDTDISVKCSWPWKSNAHATKQWKKALPLSMISALIYYQLSNILNTIWFWITRSRSVNRIPTTVNFQEINVLQILSHLWRFLCNIQIFPHWNVIFNKTLLRWTKKCWFKRNKILNKNKKTIIFVL